MVGIGVGIFPFSITMLGGGLTATQEVARLLVSGENVQLHLFGDSRTSTTVYKSILKTCSAVAWGGVMTPLESITASTAWTAGFGTGQTGDARTLTNLVGVYQDEVSPFHKHICVDLIPGGTTPFSFTNSLYSYSYLSRDLTEIAWDRGVAAGHSRDILWVAKQFTPAATKVRSMQRNSTNTSIILSPETELAEGYTSILSSKPLIEANDQAGLGWTQNIEMVDDGTFGVVNPAIKYADGVMLYPWSVGGRSVYGWLDNDLLSTEHMEELFPLYNAQFGGESVVWLDLGANRGLNTAGDSAEFVAQLTALIAKIRASMGDVYVMLTTQYPVDPTVYTSNPDYFVAAAKTVAATLSRVACFDTHSVMPSYADGVTAGYYADNIHYNTVGREALFAALSTLISAAA